MKHRSSTMIKRSLFLLPFALIVFFILSMFSFTPSYAQSSSYFRFANGAAKQANLDVFIDGQVVVSNIPYTHITNYLPISAGTHTIKIASTGKGVNAATLTQSVAAVTGTFYTIAAAGVSITNDSLLTYRDNNFIPLAGVMKGRIYDLSPNSNPTNITADVANFPGINGLQYKQATTYLVAPPGNYTFTATDAVTQKKLQIHVSLQGNIVYSIFAFGSLKGSPDLQFETSQVQAIPALPQTGSDPYATNSWLSFWLKDILIVVTLILIAGCIAFGRKYLRRPQTS